MDIGTSSHEADPTYYDVFLSFRGKDTRYSFTDHLYETLKRTTALRIFRDDDEIEKGRGLKPEIEKAIRTSRASIVVLSENYAESTWCLDELSLILEQRKVGHIVFPIFYHVNPSDFRKQEGTFEMAVKPSGRWTYDNVIRWKAAFTEVADLSGFPIIIPRSTSETDIIAKIVETIDRKLDLKLVTTPPNLTGINTRAEDINSWLRNEQSGANVFAIYGMGGSGKTTLAQYIYNSNKNFFGSSSFLNEIGNHNKHSQDMLGLQNQLLTDIFGGMYKTIRTVSEATRKIEDALEMKRVFIVLDDIEETNDLHILLGTKALHTQSRIIITTRRHNIRALFGSISRRFEEQKLELMNYDESLELLSWHAFRSKVPMEGFKEHAVKLARYCGGNPLALKVLGSLLFVSVEDQQNIEEMLEVWKSTLRSLSSLKGDLDSNIQVVLQRSFHSLPNNRHKELLLHIACFFIGEYKDYVVKILEQDWYAEAGIKVLTDRSLLTVSPSKKLTMHQLLQEMVRTIIRGKSSDPAEHSIVWCHDEACHLLTKGEGSKIIEGLALDMRKVKEGTKVKTIGTTFGPRWGILNYARSHIPKLGILLRGNLFKPLVLKTDSLAKMDRLKLLQLKYVELTGSYENLPELRWLCWHGYNLKTISSGLLMSSLVAIDMSYGNLEIFEPPMVLNSLKILNLEGSRKLVSLRNLYLLPNLEDLILWNCSSLTHVCKTIGGLESLALLDLTGCKNLWKALPENVTSCTGGGIPQRPFFSLPHSLKFLFLNNCNLQHNNDVPLLFSGQSFLYMNLGNNLFEFLPNNIDLKTLRVLELTSCPRLKSLICLPGTLDELYTYSCKSLKKITFQSARFKLRKFGYEGCYNLLEIQGLLKLVALENLDEADLGHLKWIKEYESHSVELVGDDIAHRIMHTQVLYEYGIMSTYRTGVMDRTKFEYMSSSPLLSFWVPSNPKKRRIQGLNVTVSYRQSGKDEGMWVLFTKICNTTKGLAWIYNPVVYGKPRVNENIVWLSYWPIGNMLDADDEVKVSIIVANGLMVRKCGASLVYMDDEVDQENLDDNTKDEEVIGGDLSEFQLSTGEYYLCRRDFFKSMTPNWLKMLVGDTNQCTELRGWRKSRQSLPLTESFKELKTFRYIAFYQKIVLRMDLYTNTEKGKRKVLKMVASLRGVQSVTIDMRDGGLTVIAQDLDPMMVVIQARKVAKNVEIISVTDVKLSNL